MCSTGELEMIETLIFWNENEMRTLKGLIAEKNIDEIKKEAKNAILGPKYHFAMAVFGPIIADSKLEIRIKNKIEGGELLFSINDYILLYENFQSLFLEKVDNAKNDNEIIGHAKNYLDALNNFSLTLSQFLPQVKRHIKQEKNFQNKEIIVQVKEKSKELKDDLKTNAALIAKIEKDLIFERNKDPFLAEANKILYRKNNIQSKIKKREKFLLQRLNKGTDKEVLLKDLELKDLELRLARIVENFAEKKLQSDNWILENKKIRDMEETLVKIKEKRKVILDLIYENKLSSARRGL